VHPTASDEPRRKVAAGASTQVLDDAAEMNGDAWNRTTDLGIMSGIPTVDEHDEQTRESDE
jgi:hypothetical protein